MRSGTCNVDEESFTNEQWPNCECSGQTGATKTVPVGSCVIDMPPALCQTVVDYSACQGEDMKDKTSTYLRAG